MKYALAIEYDGSNFKGWQTQAGMRCIQSELEKAISRVANETVHVFSAGRTDAGVHASRQIIHFETQAKRDCYNWLLGCNSNLPRDIVVKWVQPVEDDFHARFSAVARRYRYFILNRSQRPGILYKKMTWHLQALDEKRMHQAAQYLLGEQDFSSFQDSDCQSKTAVRNIHFLNIKRSRDIIRLDIQATAFLHHMVRNIVGTLLPIGEGKQDMDWFQSIIAAKDRQQAGITAPADGLYLIDVVYPEQFNLPKEPLMSFIEEDNDA